jgi:hypothetical protein
MLSARQTEETARSKKNAEPIDRWRSTLLANIVNRHRRGEKYVKIKN